jgi:hypothetical protein
MLGYLPADHQQAALRVSPARSASARLALRAELEKACAENRISRRERDGL